jgi:hypothetical protein
MQTIVVFEFIDDGLPERIRARNRSVMRIVILNSANASLANILRRVEIGFTSAEANDIDSLRSHLGGFGSDRQGH